MTYLPRVTQKVHSGRLPGKKDNAAFGQQSPELNTQFDAVHAWHDDVADDHVRHEGLRGRKGAVSRRSGDRVESFTIQNFDERFRDGLFVIDYQDPKTARRPALAECSVRIVREPAGRDGRGVAPYLKILVS